VHNALYWLDEFHLDGLRLDAVHAMADGSSEHVLTELARAVAEGLGRDRLVHLVLENNANETRLLTRAGPDKRPLFLAQWNDDLHHASTSCSRASGAATTRTTTRRCLISPAASPRLRVPGTVVGLSRPHEGEPSAGLPPTSFVGFLQNHDQVGTAPSASA